MATREQVTAIPLVLNRGFRTVAYLFGWIALVCVALALAPFWLRSRSGLFTVIWVAIVLVPAVASAAQARWCWLAEGSSARMVVSDSAISIEQPALLHRPLTFPRSIVRAVCIGGDLKAPANWTVSGPWRPPVVPSAPVPSAVGLLNWEKPRGTFWSTRPTALPREGHNLLIVLTRPFNTGSAPRRGLRSANATNREFGLRYSGFLRHTPILGVLALTADLAAAETACEGWNNATHAVSAEIRQYLAPRALTVRDFRHVFTRLPQEPADAGEQ